MDAREAKRTACWHAATLIETAMEGGWPFNPSEFGGVSESGLSDLTPDDEGRVAQALEVLVRELERRGLEARQ